MIKVDMIKSGGFSHVQGYLSRNLMLTRYFSTVASGLRLDVAKALVRTGGWR